MTALTEKKIELNLLTLIIIGLVFILILFGGYKLYDYKVSKLTAKIDTEVKLRNALIDSVKYYTNSRNEVVAEKLTLQADIKTLTTINDKLSLNQQELIKRVKEIEKSNTIIAAALVQTNVILDSMRNASNVIVDTIHNNIAFSDSTKDVKYNILVSNVKPFDNKTKPELKIQDLVLPNKTYIQFFWGKKTDGYPTTFSVTNSNPYFHTNNIDSYTIPELDKKVIKPNGWQKIGNFFKKSSNMFITVGVGVIVGAGATYLIVK